MLNNAGRTALKTRQYVQVYDAPACRWAYAIKGISRAHWRCGCMRLRLPSPQLIWLLKQSIKLPMDDANATYQDWNSGRAGALYARSASVDRDFLLETLICKSIVKDVETMHASSLTLVFPYDLGPRGQGRPKMLEFILRQLLINALQSIQIQSLHWREERLISASVSEPRVGNHLQPLSSLKITALVLEEDLSKGFTGQCKYAKSTGKGLYLCYELCNEMGLGLAVSSTIGKGSTFFYYVQPVFTDL